VRTGDVLVMASNPSFDADEVDSEAAWDRLRSHPGKPFLNRALGEYYLPGSTFNL
jgi:cell division protein FtsI/penicillin-binding protein 2